MIWWNPEIWQSSPPPLSPVFFGGGLNEGGIFGWIVWVILCQWSHLSKLSILYDEYNNYCNHLLLLQMGKYLLRTLLNWAVGGKMVIQLKMRDHEGVIPHLISRWILFLLFRATKNVARIYFRPLNLLVRWKWSVCKLCKFVTADRSHKYTHIYTWYDNRALLAIGNDASPVLKLIVNPEKYKWNIIYYFY